MIILKVQLRLIFKLKSVLQQNISLFINNARQVAPEEKSRNILGFSNYKTSMSQEDTQKLETTIKTISWTSEEVTGGLPPWILENDIFLLHF